MGLRTLAQIEAEYNAARDAYLKALNAESYSVNSGGIDRTTQRARVDTLYKQMQALEKEYNTRSRGGLKAYSVTPRV